MCFFNQEVLLTETCSGFPSIRDFILAHVDPAVIKDERPDF